MTTNRAKDRPSRAKKRTRISGRRNILTVHGIPKGWVARWANDVDGRIEQLQEAGWEFVTDKEIAVGDRTVNSGSNDGSLITKRVGGGITAYLMATPQEYYDEDKALSQAEIDEMEKAITNRRDEGQYGTISISRK
jgi:hypothetical protein